MGVSTGASLVLSAALGSGEALPAWLHFDPSKGAFSGTPPVLEDAGVRGWNMWKTWGFFGILLRLNKWHP